MLRRARALAPSLVLALAIACGGDDPPPPGSSDDGSGSDEGDPPARPTFAEPASGRLSLQNTRTTDLALTVSGVTPGVTELVVDGQSLGSLPEGAVLGRLEADELRLRVRGSMRSALHRMVLRSAGIGGLETSEEIIVEIVGGLESVSITADVTPTELPGSRLVVGGQGDDAVLVVYEPAPEGPRLHLLPWAPGGWDVDGRRTVAAPGLSVEADRVALPATALRYDRSDDDPGRVRVAWRVGPTGSRIDLLDVPWDEAEPAVPPSTSLSADDARAGQPAEWAELGRPWLMGDQLVAELYAPTDVEAPRPGDRAVVYGRVHDQGAGIDAPQRISVRGERVDLDLLGPAVDPIAIEYGGPPVISVRADHNQPLVLQLDPSAGLQARPTVLDGRDRSFSFVDVPLATITGAFGSRTVGGLIKRTGGRMRVAFIDDLGDGGVVEQSLSSDHLPELDGVRGELAVGSLMGISVFLLPYGPASPLHVVYGVGSSARVESLDDLHCDSAALAAAPGEVGPAVALACTTDGVLQLGTLEAEPAD